MTDRPTITLVGGGSSAHVLIPFLSRTGHTVNILTRRPGDWSPTVEVQLQSCDGRPSHCFRGVLNSASDRPEEVIPQADVVVLCMPVSQYRAALHRLAPYIKDSDDVLLGTMYGQAGFNWMADEVKNKFGIRKVTVFAIGLLPWICRTIAYGRAGVMYGPKAVNVVALSAPDQFSRLNEVFLKDTCETWFETGAYVLSDSFLSLTLSVDNQIIHPARCYGLHLRYGGQWENPASIPYFYRDFDELSASILKKLDAEYSAIRDAIRWRFPQKSFRYMLDYLALERLSYQSQNTDICESFTKSTTLGAIMPPTVQNGSGKWIIDKNHRFFTDDIHYGLCIGKWMAEKANLATPTLDEIITWAQDVLS